MTRASKENYERIKHEILTQHDICSENKELFGKYFSFMEVKLKRQNNLRQLDENTYKTLIKYTHMLRNINKWFENKPLCDITKKDIERVYNNLEDGVILSSRGTYFKSKHEYYTKMFKSKLFQLAGNKDILAREVIEYNVKPKDEVRFIEKEDFLKLLTVTNTFSHKVLLWLAWDIGENITSLLKLKKSDCVRQMNNHTNEPEYLINLHSAILKRSRRARGETTLYPDTVQHLDIHLNSLGDSEPLFSFGYPYAKKFFERIVKKAKVKCRPFGERPTLKDLRSGMACHLLREGWSTDDINARLGHSVTSKEIAKYVNFLNIDRNRPKTKQREFEVQSLKKDLEATKSREKFQAQKLKDMQERMEKLELALGIVDN